MGFSHPLSVILDSCTVIGLIVIYLIIVPFYCKETKAQAACATYLRAHSWKVTAAEPQPMLLPPGSTLRLRVSLALWGEGVSVDAVSHIHWQLILWWAPG